MVPDRLSSTEQLIVNSNAGSGAYSSHRAYFLPSFAGRAGGSGSDDCAVCQQRFPSTGSNLLPPTQPGVCRAGAACAGGGRRMDSLLLRDRFHFTRAIACAAGRGQAQRGCRQAGVLLGPAGSYWVLLGCHRDPPGGQPRPSLAEPGARDLPPAPVPAAPGCSRLTGKAVEPCSLSSRLEERGPDAFRKTVCQRA